jgi:MYXO-CTERM domain-containing protein
VNERDPQRWARFAASIVALFTLGVVIPLGLIAASRSRFDSANPFTGADPPWRWGLDTLGDTLTSPIADDTVIDVIVRLSLSAVWVAVTIIVVTTLIEVIHAVRHRGLSFPDVRGVLWAQSIARFIAIGVIAVLPMTTSATSLASTLGARAAATTSFTSAAVSTPTAVSSAGHTAAPAPAPTAAAAPTTSDVHIVESGESIYSIAVDLAGGDLARVLEIADSILDANLDTVMPGGQRFTNPAYVEAGWVLQIPVPVASTYTVEPGDTLWDIADEQLGDATSWPQIWELNNGDDMGGGHTFDNPHLILSGWELDLTEPVGQPTIEPPTQQLSEASVERTVDASIDNRPLPLSPPATPDSTPAITPTTASTTTTASTSTTANTSTTTTTTTTTTPAQSGEAGANGPSTEAPAPQAPSPIRIEHAALVAAGLLALVGVRRRQRLRAAMPRHRVPEPRVEAALTERRLRTIDAGERMLRADVACRAAARSLLDSGSQIGWVAVSPDGVLSLRLTAPATLPLPWTGGGQSWRLGAEVPIEILGEAARQVGQPCVALVQLGVTTGGDELLVDLEACGVLAIAAGADQADQVVTAVAAALASSLFAEVAHLVGVSLPVTALLDHRNAHIAGTADAALELACALAGSTAINERSSFELRSLRTGGEMWEPAVVLLRACDGGADVCGRGYVPPAGHGVAIVVVDECQHIEAPPARLVATVDGWQLEAFGASIGMTPVGVNTNELLEITELLVDADRELEPADSIAGIQWADEPGSHRHDLDSPAQTAPFTPRPHEIVVGLMGGVEVHARTGEAGSFERSKTVELIAWLTTHRDRATRSGARTALWDLDVRDATFANVVSEARRALARLVEPPDDEEWVARTLTEQLPVHDLVVTDAELLEDRLAHARMQPPNQAIDTLRPAVELVRDMPFARTSYLWPDAEGITSNLVLLAISATAEFAGHALSLGDTDGVFWATGKGLRVLPGHEELIALRMQAHARSGDLAGVRHEWESYERVLVADAWSDGEPAPKLLALRHELLNPATS